MKSVTVINYVILDPFRNPRDTSVASCGTNGINLLPVTTAHCWVRRRRYRRSKHRPESSIKRQATPPTSPPRWVLQNRIRFWLEMVTRLCMGRTGWMENVPFIFPRYSLFQKKGGWKTKQHSLPFFLLSIASIPPLGREHTSGFQQKHQTEIELLFQSEPTVIFRSDLPLW